MNWNRFIVVIVSIICLGGITKLVVACAGGDDPYDTPSFFLNTINKQPAFVPFYYTPSLVFYTDGYDFDSAGFDDKLPDENMAMWGAYTNKEVPEADIDSFVYTFSKSDVTNVYEHVKSGGSLAAGEQVRSNKFTKWLISHKDVAAAQYLLFAKTCEPNTVPLDAIWNNKTNEYVTPKRDSAAMQALVNEGVQRYSEVKSKDLQQRYAYQAMRMAFYSRQYAQTIALFNKLVTDRTNNFLYYRCLALKAGALYKTNSKPAAAYLYSLVFDKTDDNKKAVYTSFRWAVNGDIAAVLGLCKDDHEKAVLYIMKGLYDYDANDKHAANVLEQAYAYDPKVKGLDIVMTRYINKIESDMIPAMGRGVDTAVSNLNTMNSLAQKVGNERKNGDAAYWYLSSAYISILTGDGANCKKMLDKAKAERMTAVEEDVHAIINVLYVMRKEKKVTAKTEEQLLPLLRTAEQKQGTRYATLFGNMMVMVLEVAYMQQGDEVKAIYCYSKASGPGYSYPWSYSGDYTDEPGRILEGMTIEGLHKVEAFMAKKDKTPFESWLTAHSMYTTGALYELEATKYIRMYQFDKAVETLQKAPDSVIAKTVLPDVLVSHIMDGQDLNKSDTAMSYNKLTFARKMLELQQTLAKTPTDGRAAYQYANGLYNMSYYGKAHNAYDYYRSSTDDYAYFDSKERRKLAGYEQEHYNVRMAEQYYKQAFANSTDKEVKARCLFMAAKCWQKSCATKDDHSNIFGDEQAYYRNTFKNPYFQQLKGGYKDTKFYSNAAGTCGYFKDYVKKGK